MEYIQFQKILTSVQCVKQIEDLLNQGSGIKTIETSENFDIQGVSDGRYPVSNTVCFVEKKIPDDKASNYDQCIILAPVDTDHPSQNCILLKVEDPREVFIQLLDVWVLKGGFEPFTSAFKDDLVTHNEAEIHPTAIIEKNVVVGKGSIVSAGCVIKSGTIIGDNVIVRENTVIGCEGIALYKSKQGGVTRFPHLAGVIIYDRVEIGASTVIVRGVLTSTIIKNDTVIGNQCNIGHGVVIGEKVWMSVGCMVGGNTKILDKSTLGMGVNVKDNVVLGEACSVGMGSVVVRNAGASQSIFGNPAKRVMKIKAGPDR
jgi:serine acetyltransferase